MVTMPAFFLAIKLTLLFFYKRLFLVANPKLRIFWWANLVYNVLWFFRYAWVGWWANGKKWTRRCWPTRAEWGRNQSAYEHVSWFTKRRCRGYSTTKVREWSPFFFSRLLWYYILSSHLFFLFSLYVTRKPNWDRFHCLVQISKRRLRPYWVRILKNNEPGTEQNANWVFLPQYYDQDTITYTKGDYRNNLYMHM